MRKVNWRTPVDPGRTRLYTYLRVHRGVPRAFVVQLEYRLDDNWQVVVQFDHGAEAPGGHDMRVEGLHMDD